MKKFLAMSVLYSAVTASAYADNLCNWLPFLCSGGGDTHNEHAAPEIDPASATGAFVLLGGSMLVINGRRKKHKQENEK